MSEDAGGPIPADAEVLAALGRGNEWLRAVLCSLARQGVHVRRTQPERAAYVLDELGRWPWYKGGQFLFDLLEWEDFMVDGPPPPLVRTAFGPQTWQRITALLNRVQGFLDVGAVSTSDVTDLAQLGADVVLATSDDLPPLEPGLYLYRDVALGLFVSAGSAWAAGQAVAQDSADES